MAYDVKNFDKWDRKTKANFAKKVLGNKYKPEVRDYGVKNGRYYDEVITPYLVKKEINKQKNIIKNKRYQERYNEAIQLGYTSEEAQKMRSLSNVKYYSYLESNTIYDRDARRKRWKYMSTYKTLADGTKTEISRFEGRHLEEIERINMSAGYDLNDSYGYIIYYNVYVNGMTENEALRSIQWSTDNSDIYIKMNQLRARH